MAIDVDHLVEERVGRGSKKLDYIPWVEAQLLLEEHFPTFEVCFVMDGNRPYHKDETGFFVSTYIQDTETGLETSPMFYPVMDNNHSAVAEPNMNQINTALWRASVKVIAITTGIGLGVFRRLKEDVPTPHSEPTPFTPKAEPEYAAPASNGNGNFKRPQFGKKVS